LAAQQVWLLRIFICLIQLVSTIKTLKHIQMTCNLSVEEC
jgi:hypothetical protein